MLDINDHPAIARTLRTGYPKPVEDDDEPYSCEMCHNPLGDFWGEDTIGEICESCLTKLWLDVPAEDRFEMMGFKLRRRGKQ